MGTQHHYTEKECKVCGVTKPRAEFPAYGGRTCRECMRAKEREARPERYQRDKKNPRYVEENRRRAREYKRQKKREREGAAPMSSAMEIGQQIYAMAETVTGAINAQKGQAAGALADALQYLTAAKDAGEDPVGTLGNLLGDGHPGLEGITGVTAGVTEAIEPIRQIVLKAINDLEAVSENVGLLGFTYQNVGESIMRGNG